MALTSGFFKASLVNDQPDRVYSSEEFGSLFDGVISDGIFKNYKDAFKVSAGQQVTSEGLKLYVGAGRAWFNKTWTLNSSSSYELTINKPSATYNRLDAIVLDIDANLDTRENKIIVIDGKERETLGSTPPLPNLIRDDNAKHWQYLIATVFVKASITNTYDAISITDVRGNLTAYPQAAPYAAPIEPTTSTIDGIIDSLENEFNAYQKTYQAEFNEWMDSIVGHLGILSNEQTVRLALMIGEVYRSDYISGEYPYVDDDGGLWLSAGDNGEKPSVDINFGYASLPYAANGRAREVIIQTSEYTIVEEE